MRFTLAFALALATLLLTATCLWAQFPNNECTTVVLHAVSGIDTDCQTALNCTTVQPATRIDNPAGLYTVYMYLKNYEQVHGVQVAFDWPATWSFGFGLWNCQPGQIFATQPSAPGPLTGTIATAFNLISGGALAPIGIMVFNQIGAGCLSIIESGYPFGNCVVFQEEETHLLDDNEGRVCVGSDGWNTCECRAATAAEAATWGQIKATYGQ
jgi:hypothetical protein